MTLIVGRRYLCGLLPGTLTVIVYLGPVPGLRDYSRVRNLMTRVVSWVKTKDLRPLLVDVNTKSGGKAE